MKQHAVTLFDGKAPYQKIFGDLVYAEVTAQAPKRRLDSTEHHSSFSENRLVPMAASLATATLFMTSHSVLM